ncbi:HD-GYP domain-containing protein [Sphingopyxis indica]|nr:HD-GYP domain-containing protein [Sphingopyxis indica]
MLLRISPDEVEIGMFIHTFEGRWIDHPFWRSRFLVETSEQLERIRQSRVEALVIDPSRSVVMPVIDEGAATDDGPAEKEPPASGPAVPAAARAEAIDRPPVHTIATPWPVAARPQPLFAPERARDVRRARKSYGPERRRALRVIDKSRRAMVDVFESARLGRAIEVKSLVLLTQEVADSIHRDPRALLNLVRLKNKDEYSYLHSVAVCALMINFARHLQLDEATVQDLGVAGLLHDIGKIAISDDILLKPGALDSRERQAVEEHPVAGHKLLAQSPSIPPAALDVCLRHHEKFDGTGYPDGLSGEKLSLFARMAAICDVYDAVTSDRAYRAAWAPCETLTEMQSWPGHFDPKLLERFADSLGIFPIGTLVRISNGLLGIVSGNCGTLDEDVTVRAFFDSDRLEDIEPYDCTISPGADDPRIICRDSPTFWRFDDWDAMRMRVMATRVGRPEKA